jgi:two-component system sensor histidine kinase ChiS
LCTPLANQGKLTGLLYLENDLTAGAFTANRLEVLNLLSTQAAISIENARLYTNLEAALGRQVQLTNAYSRFVPREILRFLGKESILEVSLGDQIQKEMTVLFSDIRTFTSMSEQMTPQENFNFINAYLSRVSPVIRQHNGFIDKYVGDAIMALFPGHPQDALEAAIAMQQEVAAYNVNRRQKDRQPIHIGVGLHCGRVMLGTVGEAARMEGTVISDAVNLAFRLEGVTKLYGAAIVVSEQTLDSVGESGRYATRFLGRVRVKGKKEIVSVLELLDGAPAEQAALKQQTKADFECGLRHYLEQNMEEARHCFERVTALNPSDQAAQLYLRRVNRFLEYGLPADWEGVEVVEEE